MWYVRSALKWAWHAVSNIGIFTVISSVIIYSEDISGKFLYFVKLNFSSTKSYQRIDYPGIYKFIFSLNITYNILIFFLFALFKWLVLAWVWTLQTPLSNYSHKQQHGIFKIKNRGIISMVEKFQYWLGNSLFVLKMHSYYIF